MSTLGMEGNNSAVNKDNHVKTNACFYRKHRRHVFETRGCTYQVHIMGLLFTTEKAQRLHDHWILLSSKL